MDLYKVSCRRIRDRGSKGGEHVKPSLPGMYTLVKREYPELQSQSLSYGPFYVGFRLQTFKSTCFGVQLSTLA